jgi:hypothetical protein
MMKALTTHAAPKGLAGSMIVSMAVAPDGGRAAATALDFSAEPSGYLVSVWDLRKGSAKLSRLKNVISMEVASDWSRLVAHRGGKKPATKFLDFDSGAVKRTVQWPEGAGTLAPSSSESLLSTR